MDKFKIDSHKLNYHPERIAQWKNDGDTFPIYMEVSPIGNCNHRCVFCGLDFMGYRSVKLECDRMSTLLPELGELGLKSIMYAGEGEPFLHPQMTEITVLTKNAGIDVAFTTNGVLMTPEKAAAVLPYTSWIKVSCNGGDDASYDQIHRGRPGDLGRAFKNIEAAVEIKRENRYNCRIGVQLVLLPENMASVTALAKRCADAGVDYLVIKPFSQHNQSINRQYESLQYQRLEELQRQVTAYANDEFQIVFRLKSMQQWNEHEKPYRKCLALPFWSYIDSSGNVWGCSVFLGREEFLYGNIHDSSFAAIWYGEKRKKSLEYVKNTLDIADCRVNCRMDAINRYLDELQNPPEHVNYI